MTTFIPLPKYNVKRLEPSKMCIKCDRWLRNTHPRLYLKIAGYRNCRHLTELEFARLQAIIGTQLVQLEEIEFALYPFLGMSGPPVDTDPPEPQRKRERMSDHDRYRRLGRRKYTP